MLILVSMEFLTNRAGYFSATSPVEITLLCINLHLCSPRNTVVRLIAPYQPSTISFATAASWMHSSFAKVSPLNTSDHLPLSACVKVALAAVSITTPSYGVSPVVRANWSRLKRDTQLLWS